MKTLKSQAYFWIKEWQEAEREANENIKAAGLRPLIPPRSW